MNIETKIQIEALKELEKTYRRPPSFCEDEKGWIYFTINGFSAVRIDSKEFWLDKNKLCNVEPLSNIFSEDMSSKKKLVLTNVFYQHEKTNYNMLKCDEFKTYINNKIFKLLYKDGCEMYAKDNKSKVYFVVNNEIYACIMPLKGGAKIDLEVGNDKT